MALRAFAHVTCQGGSAHAIVYGHTAAEAATLADELNAAIRKATALWSPDGSIRVQRLAPEYHVQRTSPRQGNRRK